MKKIILSCVVALAAMTTFAQLPAVDIWYSPISWQGASLQLNGLVNITNRVGYDNQPSFTGDGAYILYTSIQKNDQADIYQYNIDAKLTAQITNTKESEYSPVMIEDEDAFTTVRVEQDSSQHLWAISMDGNKAKRLVPSIDSIGYYGSINDKYFACFMVTDIPSLAIIDRKSEKMKTVDLNIGRCIKQMPGSNNFSYLVKTDTVTWHLYAFDIKKNQRTLITATPAGSEDYVWTADGKLLMAREHIIYMFDTKNTAAGWQQVVSVDALKGKHIFRMALSPAGDKLAFVAEE